MIRKETILELVLGLAGSLAVTGGIYAIHDRLPQPEPVVAATVSADGITYLNVEAPEAASPDGVVSAEEWSAIYPEIAASMASNSDNNYRISYLDEDPYLSNIYEGYGFAIDYTSAIGHSYTLEDVHDTQRPHALANCLTCKSPNFTKMVNDMGEEAYQYDFEETWQQLGENISCYNCHENQAGNAGQLVVTHSYMELALGDNMKSIDPAVLSCGQCHIEYYFDPETKATRSPVSSVETMHPTAILEYYKAMDFSDWTQESTGTRMLKAQHPEMETFLQGKHAAMLSCADCHMAVTTAENGTVYHSHMWQSPLENETLLATCAKCHGETDMTAFVHSIQEEITGREKEVGEKLSGLKDALAAKVAEGAMEDAALDPIRTLYREAQWYWDFCYVENSEGAHNSALARECMDTAESKIDEAMGLLEA